MLSFIFDKPVKKLLILTPISSPLVSTFYIPLELVFVFEAEVAHSYLLAYRGSPPHTRKQQENNKPKLKQAIRKCSSN